MFGSIFSTYYVAIKQLIDSLKKIVTKTIHEMSL